MIARLVKVCWLPRARGWRSRAAVLLGENGEIMSKRKTEKGQGQGPQDANRTVPRWVPVEGNLYWNGRAVLHLAGHAATERSVLDAFEKSGWMSVIADPLPREQFGDPTQPRRSALWNLNHRQGEEQELAFFSVRGGHIGWRSM